MVHHRILLTGLLMLPGVSLTAGEKAKESGVVHVYGPAASPTAVLKKKGAKKGVRLCKDKFTNQISGFITHEVEVTGSWKLISKKKQRRCLQASTWKVLRMATGRDPIVGTLRKRDRGYFLDSENGKSYLISYTPDKLKNMQDERLVTDIYQDGDDRARDTWSVRSFIIYPHTGVNQLKSR